MSYSEPIDVWRMSASRPWQLEKTSDALFKRLKYRGELRFHLIESVLVEDLSEQCIEIAKSLGYNVHVIKPAKGQGFAMNEAIHKVITSKYSIKWEDDFRPEKNIPINTCVDLMEKYPHINQICFNKRPTLEWKWATNENGEKYKWYKEQRYFKLGSRKVPLVVKEKWWFGPAVWRMDYIRPKFKWWPTNTHNLMNDLVLLPLAGFVQGDPRNNWRGRKVPAPDDIEKHIGCYIYGKTGDPGMAEHTGFGDSIWSGEYQERMRKEGRKIIGT